MKIVQYWNFTLVFNFSIQSLFSSPLPHYKNEVYLFRKYLTNNVVQFSSQGVLMITQSQWKILFHRCKLRYRFSSFFFGNAVLNANLFFQKQVFTNTYSYRFLPCITFEFSCDYLLPSVIATCPSAEEDQTHTCFHSEPQQNKMKEETTRNNKDTATAFSEDQ